MGCLYCNAVTIPDGETCPECLVSNVDYDPFSEEEMEKINDALLLSVFRDEEEVVLNPDFLERFLNEDDSD